MLEWIKTWTFFNWLAFFSLRSRYKDWRGGQSRKAYTKRLNELKRLVDLIGRLRKDPIAYFFIMVHAIFRLLIFFIIAFTFFVSVMLSFSLPVKDYGFSKILGGGCVLLLGWIIGTFIGILRTARYTAYPDLMKTEVSDFLRSGAKKGLLSEEAGDDMLKTLGNYNLLTIDEYGKLEALYKETI
jgi:hypothetical protein